MSISPAAQAKEHLTPRGVLHPQMAERSFALTLHRPAPDLAFFVEHFWIVRWDLRGREPHLQETLPHPCVHLVVEGGGASLYGVTRGRFSIVLEGQGRVFGIKFRPGAFHPFLLAPVCELTDTVVDVREVFGGGGASLEREILARGDDRELVAVAERWLCERLPEPDPQLEMIHRAVACILAEREVTRVDDVVRRLGVGKRTLQRLFRRYVGVSPKWTIQRYRLIDAAEAAHEGAADWSRLALQLGYHDQAHLIRDFKMAVGSSPAAYARATLPDAGRRPDMSSNVADS